MQLLARNLYGALEKWFNSPDFLSDIQGFESLTHHQTWRVPEWLGTGLENLGGVTAYRVRFSGSPPDMVYINNENILKILDK